MHYLKSLNLDENEVISSKQISDALSINIEVVKKDIASISSEKGTPRIGRKISILINDLENFLGVDVETKAILIGVGHLGRAFLNFNGFMEYGLKIVAGFDVDPQLYEIDINGIPIYDMSKMKDFIRNNNVEIAILTLPTKFAQETFNELVRDGIKGVWNFAPLRLQNDSKVIIQNVNMASSLAILSHQLHIKNK